MMTWQRVALAGDVPSKFTPDMQVIDVDLRRQPIRGILTNRVFPLHFGQMLALSLPRTAYGIRSFDPGDGHIDGGGDVFAYGNRTVSSLLSPPKERRS